jgi:hypothetical protein
VPLLISILSALTNHVVNDINVITEDKASSLIHLDLFFDKLDFFISLRITNGSKKLGRKLKFMLSFLSLNPKQSHEDGRMKLI